MDDTEFDELYYIDGRLTGGETKDVAAAQRAMKEAAIRTSSPQTITISYEPPITQLPPSLEALLSPTQKAAFNSDLQAYKGTGDAALLTKWESLWNYRQATGWELPEEMAYERGLTASESTLLVLSVVSGGFWIGLMFLGLVIPAVIAFSCVWLFLYAAVKQTEKEELTNDEKYVQRKSVGAA